MKSSLTWTRAGAGGPPKDRREIRVTGPHGTEICCRLRRHPGLGRTRDSNAGRIRTCQPFAERTRDTLKAWRPALWRSAVAFVLPICDELRTGASGASDVRIQEIFYTLKR